MQTFAARREYLQAATSVQQRLGEHRTRFHEVFAVVEDQQKLAVGNIFFERFQHRPTGCFLHAQYRCDRLRHQARIGQRRQLHEPHTIRVVAQ